MIFLQVLWRRVLARRALAQRTVEERSAVIIQRWWRSIKQRRVFLLQRQSTILIQFWWRNVLAERRRQKLAVELQAAVRAYFVRHNLEVIFRLFSVQVLKFGYKLFYYHLAEEASSHCYPATCEIFSFSKARGNRCL